MNSLRNVNNGNPKTNRPILSPYSPVTVIRWDKYQIGHFDGTTDMYEYSNSRDDIPQTKFLFINNKYSDELKQSAWDFLRDNICNMEAAPASFHDAHSYRMEECWGDQELHQFLNGSSYSKLNDRFWQTLKAA